MSALFDVVTSHNYWSSAGFTQWNATRWRLFRAPSVPIYVGECGRDRVRDGPNGTYLPTGPGPAFGWQAQGLDGDQYLAELAAYDAELRRDGVFGVVFTGSPDDLWARLGFSTDEIADRCHGFTNLGPHDLMGSSPQSLAWAAVAPIVKSCDQTAAIRRARPDAITIYRRRFSPAEQDDILARTDAAHLVGAIVEGLAGFRHPRLHVELLNEIGKGQRLQYEALAKVAVPQLRAIGLKVAGPSWATGDYEEIDWATFALGGGPTVATLKGVDVSNWQAVIDWSAVAASGRSFAWIKASEDPTYRDPYLGANWAGSKAAGLVRGAYHYARPDQASPQQSVALLAEQIDAVGGLEEGDLVALDIEAGEGNLLAWVTTWLALAEARFGAVPVIYSGLWFMQPHGLVHPALAGYPLWYASYQPTQPPVPAPWPRIDFWQFSAHGSVPGVQGDCDENVFNGDRAALAALGKQGGTVPTDPTTLRDRTYALAEQLQALGPEWESVGFPQHAEYVRTQGEAIKKTMVIGKGER